MSTTTDRVAVITGDGTRTGVPQMYRKAEVTASDVAEVVASVLSRPRHLALDEILLRPAGQTQETPP